MPTVSIIILGRWRQQVCLMEALRRLAEGATVTTVALELGYESTSAFIFIAMFKRTLGKTPGQVLRRVIERTT